MTYEVIVNNRSYELPAKTISVMEKLEEVLAIDNRPLTIKQKYQKVFEFVKTIMGEDAEEILGGSKVADIDVGEMELLVLKIQDAYNAPISDYKTGQLEEAFDSIPAEKIVAITKAAQALAAAESRK